ATPRPDSGPPDLMCMLGTPDHCRTCNDPCPGMDDDKTMRVCKSPDCDILCKGEYYDLNQDIKDGCESLDAPAQDTPQTAVTYTLPDMVDPMFKTNPLNLLGKIYWDLRMHDAPPELRPNGREDWYQFTAVGTGKMNTIMTACLSINQFPVDNKFEICISDNGKTTFDAVKACKSLSGGTMMSVCVSPPAMTDAGTYFVRV